MNRYVTSRIGRSMSITFIFLFSILELGAQNAFVTTWKTDNSGTSDSTSITVPIDSNEVYNYNVDWDNDGVFDEFGITSSVTHDFGVAGNYTIRITGDFPRILFKNEGDKDKIIDISQWGDNQWTTMAFAFRGCSNLNISATDAPDLSQVTSFTDIFFGCSSLNANIENWDVSNVSSFYFAFGHCAQFNQPLNNWDMSSATSLQRMFIGCSSFNQPLNNWDVSNVTSFSAMFSSCSVFNQPLNNWDMSNGVHLGLMFLSASNFNQDIGDWDVSKAITLKGMFHKAHSFNQDIGDWDVGKVTEMGGMFKNAIAFNQDIGNWDVSNVTVMPWMFAGAAEFNQDIGNWDVSKVTLMTWMFFYAKDFNQDLSNWNVGNVTNMSNMFKGPNNQFNQDIGSWDVSSVTNMNSMFEANPSFDQNIGNWDVSNVGSMTRMFNLTKLSTPNYDSLLIGWNKLTLQDSVIFNGGNSIYCEGWAARANMISTNGWTIEDGGAESVPPIAICNNIDAYLDETGTFIITPEMFDNGSYDLCSEVSLSASQTIFDCNNIGTNQIIFTVSDANGNSSICESTVVIYDLPFNFNCPQDITVSANSSGCMAQVNWVAPQGNCNNTITSSHQSGNIFPLGITTVTYFNIDSDANAENCSFNITVINDLSTQDNWIKNPTCFDAKDGEISLSPFGGEAPYLVDWKDDYLEDFADIENLVEGNYQYQITDSNGCTHSDSIQLTQPSPLVLSMEMTNSSAPVTNEIDLTVSGGTAPYFYDWNIDGNGDYDDEEDVSIVDDGTYSVFVKDAKSCIEYLEFTILTDTQEINCAEQNFNIYPNPSDGEFIIEFENCEGAVDVEIFDLLGRKIYSLQTSELKNTIKFEDFPAGNYFLMTTTDKGSFVKSFEIISN